MLTPASAPSEMSFFNLLARCGSFSAAARELEVSTPAVSKRLAHMEARLGVQLLNRTTRRVALTPEGETYLLHARRILADIDDMENLLCASLASPKGHLRVNATLGFGRGYIAPLISEFTHQHPQVQVQLHLSVDPPALGDDAYDVCIRFGEPPDARILARYLAPNRRLLCAAPAYLAKQGNPKTPHDLGRHNWIAIRQGEETYGTLRLSQGNQTESVKVRGNLSTNDGEIAVKWALAGHGVVMRAEWDIARYLRSGRLQQLLGNYSTPSADIYAVYPQRHQSTARVRVFVDFLTQHFAKTSTRTEGLVTGVSLSEEM